MGWAAALVVTGAACTDLPPAPRFDTRVATVRFVATEPIMAVGQCALYSVEARNQEGHVIPAPDILWSSSSTAVALVEGFGVTARVTARSDGRATVRASSSQSGLRAETSVRVVPCSRGPCVCQQ